MRTISAKGEYAIKAVLDLALHESGGVVSIQEIATRQAIPQRYLEQVLLQLKRAGVLSSRRGAAGGYQLGRPPQAITVGEVLRAVEGKEVPLGTLRENGRGTDGHAQELAELWEEIATAVARVVDGLTFADLAARAAARRREAQPVYHI
jgi:Rrf2 family cysteine metabolism transcriptional repressor